MTACAAKSVAWDIAALADVGRIVTGTTPPTSDADNYGGETPFVGPADLGATTPLVSAAKSITAIGASKARLLPEGTVLVCCIGATVGKVGIAGREVATNQQINSVIFDRARVHPRFALHYLGTQTQQLRHLASSTTMPLITKGTFSELPIPLPPLDEQKRIAAILDKADAIRRKRKQAIALTDQLLRATFLDMFGDPVTNPKGWPVVQLDTLATVRSGVTKGRKLDQRSTVAVPYLRVANVQDGHLDLAEIKTIDAMPSDLDRYRLQDGDVLLTEGGDPDKLGRGAVWRDQVPGCIHQNHVFCVRPDLQAVTPEFLSAQIGSPRGKRYFLRAAKQTTGIATINSTQLKGFPVLLPPFEVQNTFDRRVARASELATKRENACGLAEDLFHSLVQRAFEGRI